MRLLGGLVLFCATAAHADGVGERVAKGEDLAKQGKWTEAIENFKAADKLEPRAKHACLIALAYIRRELWPQAEVFLTVCQHRASAADPVPDWVPLAKQQLDERLGTAKVATVTIRVNPAALANQAAIGVSSFEPDETFGPRAIHLPRGTHLITATVRGATAQQTIEITDDAPRDVILDFDVKRTPIAVAPRPVIAKGPSRAPWVVMAVGGAIMLGGAGYHVLEFKGTRDELDAASTPAEYDTLSKKFDSQRISTLTLYGVGAAVIVTGVVLKYTLFNQERGPRVGATPTRGGGLMVVEWSR